MTVSFYLEACLQGKEHRHNIKDEVSTNLKVFFWFLLKTFLRFPRFLLPLGIGDNKPVGSVGSV